MKIFVSKLLGDASVSIYNKFGELLHIENFKGKCDSGYIRKIPVSEVEFDHSKAIWSGAFEYQITNE
jgi:hypothetical protein